MDASRFTQVSDIDEMSEAEKLLNLYFSGPKTVINYETQQQQKSSSLPY